MSLWWSPTGKPTPNVRTQMETIFFDVMEAEHNQPSEFWGTTSQSSEPASVAAGGTSTAAVEKQPVLPNAASAAHATQAPPEPALPNAASGAHTSQAPQEPVLPDAEVSTGILPWTTRHSSC